MQTVEADWTHTGERFEQGIQVTIRADGTIARVERGKQAPHRRLHRTALLPGFVNAHSHAFQRGLRGCGEWFPRGAGSFWSWREGMYGLVASLDADGFYELTRRAFEEMLAAGITAVGEFHYLHHASDEADHALDDVVTSAARDAGIRLVLLQVYYRTGGIGRELGKAQRRFRSPSPAAYLAQLDGLARRLDAATQTLGMVAHSVRAAPLADIVELHRESRTRALVFHMHVEEQRREVEECRKAYGQRPLALLLDHLEIDGRFTAIHGTHSRSVDLERLARAGGSLCVCPLTEANLADGIPDLAPFRHAGGRICVGTDSNARIAMTEELRWLEYVQRLRREQRGCLTSADGHLGQELLDVATVHGARSLGIATGRIAPDHFADLVAVDLDHPSLAGWTPANLLETLFLGTGNEAVRAVCVGGRWLGAGTGADRSEVGVPPPG